LLSLHAEFILHAATKIINLALGRASYDPAQVAGSGPAPIKKNSTNFKNHFLKKCDFLKYFSTNFA